jgi:hypothetical protein
MKVDFAEFARTGGTEESDCRQHIVVVVVECFHLLLTFFLVSQLAPMFREHIVVVVVECLSAAASSSSTTRRVI